MHSMWAAQPAISGGATIWPFGDLEAQSLEFVHIPPRMIPAIDRQVRLVGGQDVQNKLPAFHHQIMRKSSDTDKAR